MCSIFNRYYGVVTLIPIFMYSNVYTPTPKLNELAENSKLQEECTKYVARQGNYVNLRIFCTESYIKLKQEGIKPFVP